jgi:hypothetical protein
MAPMSIFEITAFPITGNKMASSKIKNAWKLETHAHHFNPSLYPDLKSQSISYQC